MRQGMDEDVTPPRLHVHQVSLSSINAPQDDEALRLFPVVTVWANLAPLRSAGVEWSEDSPRIQVLFVVDAVLDARNPGVTNIVVAEANRHIHEDNTEDGEGVIVVIGDEASRDPEALAWEMRVPTAWLGCAMAMSYTPLRMRMVIVDGPPPFEPENHVIPVEKVAFTVVPVQETCGAELAQVMDPEWADPQTLGEENAVHTVIPDRMLMRDMLWACMSGMALGQERAFHAAVTLAQHAEVAASSEDETTHAHFHDLLEAVSLLTDSVGGRNLLEDLHSSTGWPAPMSDLMPLVREHVDLDVFSAVDRGVPLDELFDRPEGIGAAMLALSVLGALSASVTVAGVIDRSQFPMSVSYLTGTWLDDEGYEPWWAMRACMPALLHHDTEVLTDLLGSNPYGHPAEGDHGHLARRWLHVTTEALMDQELTADKLCEEARRSDVQPPGFDDVLFVARRLLENAMETDSDECFGCYASASMIDEVSDQTRLLRSAAKVLPMLADLSAQRHDLAVGETEWLQHRQEFLMRWLDNTAAVVADAD